MINRTFYSMASHILDLLLEERPKDAYTIVNLGKKKKRFD